jgi:hypothetical protein
MRRACRIHDDIRIEENGFLNHEGHFSRPATISDFI